MGTFCGHSHQSRSVREASINSLHCWIWIEQDFFLFRPLAAAKRWCLSLHKKGYTSGTHFLSFRASQPPLVSSLNWSVPSLCLCRTSSWDQLVFARSSGKLCTKNRNKDLKFTNKTKKKKKNCGFFFYFILLVIPCSQGWWVLNKHACRCGRTDCTSLNSGTFYYAINMQTYCFYFLLWWRN